MKTSAARIALLFGAALALPSHAQQSAATATVEPLEIVSENGASTGVSNEWGGHQGRITVHNDKTIRILYLTYSTDPVSTIRWILQKRDPATGKWSLEKSGNSTDDVNLVRDPTTDKAYVIAYPASVPTIYSDDPGPPVVIPGQWEVLPSSRHYSAVGIGAEGTLCFKTSVQLATTIETTNTETHFICGKNSASGGWTWNSYQDQVRNIGNRQAYDYLFPAALAAGTLTATSQSDLHKSATTYTGATNLDYVFNGFRRYTTEFGGTDKWKQYSLLEPFTSSDDSKYTSATVQRPIDSFISSQKLMFSTYYTEPPKSGLQDPPVTTPTRGFSTVISDVFGNVLQRTAWAVPRSGNIRIFEDGKKRMWLIMTNQGTKSSSLTLYPLTQSAPGQVYVLGAGKELGQVFGRYSIHGAPVLAVPRTGQVPSDDRSDIDNTIYASIAACERLYPDTPDPAQTLQSPYYYSGNATQRILHFRIKLPQ